MSRGSKLAPWAAGVSNIGATPGLGESLSDTVTALDVVDGRQPERPLSPLWSEDLL